MRRNSGLTLQESRLQIPLQSEAGEVSSAKQGWICRNPLSFIRTSKMVIQGRGSLTNQTSYSQEKEELYLHRLGVQDGKELEIIFVLEEVR
ncbi:unnamed protein product [Prunus armeniaca]|uniref:Uncharacterized protein n=1 Tax=Prunus armeniaca TaxID=36596 RepID=A0A6J5WD34_PRUAR|nr:unnamed protein product [Prunus armeniaca]